MRIIEVVPYNPKWPQMFEREAQLIKQALGDNCIAIHHIGSTSVPGLSAKPIIDILPVVKDILAVDNAKEAMERLGYQAKGEYGIAFRRFFQKEVDNIRTHHVHIYEQGDPEINRYLKFRDWIRTHPEDATAYASLKKDLASKFPNDILSYCSGKDAFVGTIDEKDGYDGYRMVQALTTLEWAKVRSLRNQHFNKKPDPFIFTKEQKDHIHFVLYKNADIIGYAHLQLYSEGKARLQMLVIEEQFQNLGYESLFLKLCKRWLAHQGYHELKTPSS